MEIKSIQLTEIRTNPNNIYEEQNIIELADSIKNWGQLENATVYEEPGTDGKKYTLVGGHRRFQAIGYLAERGQYEPLINVRIIEKPLIHEEEKMLIVADNHQRTKDKETKIKEIKYANDYWNYLISIEKKPKLKAGEKKRDWIAKKTGYSARTIQDILSEIKRRNTTNSSVSSVTQNNEDIDAHTVRYLNRAIKNIEQAIKDYDNVLSNLNNLERTELCDIRCSLRAITERLSD